MSSSKSRKELQNFRVHIVTWNVASTYPEEDVRSLLGLKTPSTPDDELPDLYAVGLQEVSIRPQNLLNQVIFEEPWISAIRCALCPYDYVKQVHYRLQGIVVVVFVKRRHLLSLREVQTGCVRTGFGGVWGNKGATSVSMMAYGTSLCFTNSHLAAHDHEYQRRIQEYNSIIESQRFEGDTSNILYHDYSFWFGDLNFRLDEVTMEEMVESIENGQVMKMMKFDQLSRAQNDCDAFHDYDEPEITFKPTFKYKIGKAVFNTSTRKPAWTDRILHRVTKDSYEGCQLDIKSNGYHSHEDFIQSDHKPVSGNFTIRVFADPKLQFVHFYDTGSWNLNRDHEFWFFTSSDMELRSNDWIGLFREHFSSLDDYTGYVWANSTPTNRLPWRRARRADDDSSNDSDSSSEILRDESPEEEFTRISPAGASHDIPKEDRLTYRQVFSDQILVLPGRYILLYLRGQCDVLGMSDPFKINDCASWQ